MYGWLGITELLWGEKFWGPDMRESLYMARNTVNIPVYKAIDC